MKHHKIEIFDADKPLIAGFEGLTVRDALTCDEILLVFPAAPSPETSGEVILTSTNLQLVENWHLASERLRIVSTVPDCAEQMEVRLKWMVHAGSRSNDREIAARAEEAIEAVMGALNTGNVVPKRDEADEQIVVPDQSIPTPDLLAEDLEVVRRNYPDLTDDLFRGDLEDGIDKIEDEAFDEGDYLQLVQVTAWMIVYWALLNLQRESCLGYRLIHLRPDGLPRFDNASKPLTCGQFLKPNIGRHELAEKMWKRHIGNLAAGVVFDDIDGRELRKINRLLSKMGLGWAHKENEKEILSMYGHGRLAQLPLTLERWGVPAGAWAGFCHTALTPASGEDFQERTLPAGKRLDALHAPISAVDRAAIVAAQVRHQATLAAGAKTVGDLRAMLNAGVPDVLLPSKRGVKNRGKEQAAQLLHVARVEFLQDGEHMKRCDKVAGGPIALQLSDTESRRSREIFDSCRRALENQPDGWSFTTFAGWQCGGGERVRLCAPLAEKSIDKRDERVTSAWAQFQKELNESVAKVRDSTPYKLGDVVPFVSPATEAKPFGWPKATRLPG